MFQDPSRGDLGELPCLVLLQIDPPTLLRQAQPGCVFRPPVTIRKDRACKSVYSASTRRLFELEKLWVSRLGSA